jgi:hypothetical protein
VNLCLDNHIFFQSRRNGNTHRITINPYSREVVCGTGQSVTEEEIHHVFYPPCRVEVLAGPAIVFVEIQYNLGSGTGAGRTWSFLSAACERRLSSPVHWFRRHCHGPPWRLPHLHVAAHQGPPPLLSPCWLLAVEAAGLWPPRQNRRRGAVRRQPP